MGAYAKIFERAGVSWTLSTQAYEATNVGVQIGSGPLAKELVQRVVDEAERLGVKYVISPECGHAYGAIRWAGPNLIGRTSISRCCIFLSCWTGCAATGASRRVTRTAAR